MFYDFLRWVFVYFKLAELQMYMSQKFSMPVMLNKLS